MIKKLIWIVLLFFCVYALYSQNKQENEPTWEELVSQYKAPEWFRDAKFGIWTHWGPQAVPGSGGGWYARHMYMPDVGREKFGENAYSYHVKTYGHPSEFGFKDIINLWRAEKFYPDSLVSFFKECGAKYFVTMANHHDHFDKFASTHHPWNSVNIGPKRDIVGEFEKAARSHDLPFGVTSHDNRHWRWWMPVFESDRYGQKKGVSYDGRMTKADGIGKWWEGYDPADLYGPPPEERTPELEEQMKENWMKRHLELVNKYEPDLLYYDSHNFSYGEYGVEVARTLHANSLKKHGKIKTVMNIKDKIPGIVWDVERGGSHRLEEEPWQSEITFAEWFYKEDEGRRHNARTILEVLIDVVSKNGTLLLNVELKPDGTIPSVQKAFLMIVGDWLKVNGEAIYGTRPWRVFGDGPGIYSIRDEETGDIRISSAPPDAETRLHYNERTITDEPYAHNEVRFTTKGESLYIIVFNPDAGKLEIPALGREVGISEIKSLILLSNGKPIEFMQHDEMLLIDLPGWAVEGNFPLAYKYPIVLKVGGVISD